MNTGIAGVDGNGQTELVEALTGLRKTESGRILLNGKDISSSTIRERILSGIAHIPEDRQKRGLVLDYSVEENMILEIYNKEPYSKNYILNREAIRKHADKIIKDFDVRTGEGAVTPVRSLSGGNQQKAIVGREVDHNPDLLIAVQPTRGLDVGSIEYIHRRLVEQRDNGKAVLLVSLELDEVLDLSDRIAIINNGELIGMVKASETDEKEVGLMMTGNQKRGTVLKTTVNKQVIIGLISVVLGLLAGALLMLITGNNPFEGYNYLFRGGLMNIERIGNTLATATPLIFTGLSVAFAFKTGLFNIGASGQMLFGGLCATAVGLSFDMPRFILLAAMILAAMIGGGLWALIPGYLKARFNVHEVVATIMMNWISYWVIYYTVPAFFKGEFLETESRNLPAAASLKAPWLTNLFDGSFINYGLFLAVIAVILIEIILNRTILGFELKAAGYNRFSAEYAGMNVNRNIILSMVIAGALAGVGGATFYIGLCIKHTDRGPSKPGV